MLKNFTCYLINSAFPGICLCCGLDSQRHLDLCRSCETDFRQTTTGCLLCAEPLQMEGICAHCQKDPPVFSRVVTPYLYKKPVDGLINRLKYHSDLSAGKVLGSLLGNHVLARSEGFPDVLAPMPIHWRRCLWRGFNQARELCRSLSETTGIPVADNLVYRRRHTPAQQNMARDARTRNLRGVFQAKPACRGQKIAIVDDVVTTASSARAVAQALIKAGAQEVEIWAIARTTLEN